ENHDPEGRQPGGDRRTAQLVEHKRQADRGCSQRDHGRETADNDGCPAGRLHRTVRPSHVPGPVTPVTSDATADPVDVIVSIPISDTTSVRPVIVTVTLICRGPSALTAPT